jgi:GTP-binding protein HflX
VVVENKLFSTLNPTTRKLTLPSGREILITDTVGFIRNLPRELVNAFRATLEELGGSSLLVHVADCSDPLVEERIESVENILRATGYDSVPRIIVFNKIDSVHSPITTDGLKSRYKGTLVSALNRETLGNLLEKLDEEIKFLDISRQTQIIVPNLSEAKA